LKALKEGKNLTIQKIILDLNPIKISLLKEIDNYCKKNEERVKTSIMPQIQEEISLLKKKKNNILDEF